mgnify:CR=1 FL=1
MPFKNGIVVSKEIRKYLSENIVQESNSRTFIYILTSGDIQKINALADEGTVDDVVQKPIFKAGVHKVLERSGLFNQ